METPDTPDTPDTPETPFRTGFVALLGKPNVGKSTLLNALLQQKVAIVSSRAQTTREPLRAILTLEHAQIVFVDTPGIHEPRHALGTMMVKQAQQAIAQADVLCMMVDMSRPPSALDRRIAGLTERARAPRLLLLNKVDLRPRTGASPDALVAAYRALAEWDMEMAISARKGSGLPALLDELVARLPEGEPLYPPDWVVDDTVQHMAAELVREKVLRFLNQEVPHAVAIEVDEWEDRERITYIRMTINVEKDGQKAILIGAGGAMLKRIGSAARQDIGTLIEREVYLDLWVKVRPHWRNDPSSLGWLGYRLKD